MQKIYEIRNGVLGDVREIDGPVAPAGWTFTAPDVDIPDGHFALWTGTGWEIVEGEPPTPVVDVEAVRAGLIAAVNTRCDDLLARLKAGYPDGEVVSWDQQVIEARALDVSPTAVTPLLSAIATQRGIDVTTLAVRVLEKANAYAVASGSIIGARQRLEDAITAATTVDELSAIDVHAGWPA